MKPKIIASLLVFCAVAQVTILVSRGRTAGPPVLVPYLLGDTLARLDGLKVDGSEEAVAIPTPTGAATVVYAFSSECAYCDDVAPEWAYHFGKQGGERIRRVAITRDRPDVAASYAERFGWDVRILSMPDMAATDRRSFLLSRTPWLYVFDHDGTLRFQGHGSALDRMGEIASRQTCESNRRRPRSPDKRDWRIMMTSRRVSGIPISFPSVVLAVLVAGCADARSTDPTVISIESDQVTWQSPEGAFWGIADVLEGDGVIWVLSPVEPFVHGLRSGAEMVAFGSQGDGPGELRSARALLPLGDAGEISIWDAASRLYRTFTADGLPVAARDAGQVGTVRGDIDVVTFGDPLRVAATANGNIVKAEFPSAVMWASDVWMGAVVRFGSHGTVERMVDFGSLRGASHEDVRTRRFLVPVPLWDACPDGSVVVLDPLARFLYHVESSREKRDSLPIPWDSPPLSRADRINYLAGQMKAELQGQRVESSEMEAMLARAERGSRDQFPVLTPLAVDIKCSEGRVWMQEYDGAAHPLGYSQSWNAVTLSDGGTSAYSKVILPSAFQLFRVSDSHLLGVVTDGMDLQRVASIPLPPSLRSPIGVDHRPTGNTVAAEERLANGSGPDGSGLGRRPIHGFDLNVAGSLDSFGRRASRK